MKGSFLLGGYNFVILIHGNFSHIGVDLYNIVKAKSCFMLINILTSSLRHITCSNE